MYENPIHKSFGVCVEDFQLRTDATLLLAGMNQVAWMQHRK